MRSDFPNLSVMDVVRGLARADAPVLLDIRLPDDAAAYPGMIPTAVPVAYDDVDAQMAMTGPSGTILICHKGLKLTAGGVSRLLARGRTAWRIVGGQMAWLAADLPVTQTTPPTAIALALDADARDVAAAWAILRFCAPRAELLEVPQSDLAGVADKFNATLPTATDAPAFPSLHALLSDVADDPLFAVQLAGAGPRPSDAFPFLDAAYRGRLDAFRHGTDAGLRDTSNPEGTAQ